MYDYCAACDCKIGNAEEDESRYTQEGAGPYCEKCWSFVKQIELLKNRVTELEQQVAPLVRKSPRTHCSIW